MKITVAGYRSPKTEQILLNAELSAKEFKEKIHIEWKNDPYALKLDGISRTPSVFINNKLKASGRVPSVYEFTTWVVKELERKILNDRVEKKSPAELI